MPESPCRRRRFLQVVAQGGVLAGAASLGVGCGGGGPSGSYAAGNVSQLAVGALQSVSGGPVAVGRDAGGVYAMTLICTHEGCDMSTQGTITTSTVICLCHGSSFDTVGNPISGPARTALQHFQVTIDAAGAITVDADVPVAESTRVAVKA
jgi:Rieske Fe-S protein